MSDLGNEKGDFRLLIINESLGAAITGAGTLCGPPGNAAGPSTAGQDLQNGPEVV